MELFREVVGLLFVLLGVACMLWAIFGRLLLPGACPVRAVIPAEGDGTGLEQTVKGLLWLRSAGLWRGMVVIEDHGLDDTGRELARLLTRRDGVELIQLI